MPIRVFRQYYPIRNVLFVIGEGMVVFGAIFLTDRMLLGASPLDADCWLYLKIFLITFVCQTCLYYNDLYDLNMSHDFSELGVRLLQALGAATIFLSGIYFVFPKAVIGRTLFFALSIAFVMVFIVCWRLCFNMLLSRKLFDRKIMVLGSGELARHIVAEVMGRKNCGYEVRGIALENPGDAPVFADKGIPRFCQKRHEGLCDAAAELGAAKVIVALGNRRSDFPTKELLECRISGMDVIEGDSFYEMITGKLSVEHINPEWLIFSEGFRQSLPTRIMKRAFDIVLSSVMLVSLSPVLLITAIVIRLDSEGPILFSQERVGEKRKPYRIHKFRSMIADAEKKSGPVWAQAKDPRITRVGGFLRKSRIDELPQLWNVLRGDMSFVGPRPEREFFVKGLEYIIPYYGARFTAKPGVTGWAQVSYGYGASVKDAIEKLNYDLFYMKNMSLLLDVVIVLRTVKTVISGMGR